MLSTVKIASGGGANRRGALLIAGVHAREIVNPDALVTLALKLCQAYTNGTGLSFGGKNYSAEQIALIVDALDVVMLPSLTPTAVRMCSHQPGRRCGARIERSTLASHAVVSTSIATLTFCGQVASAPAAPRAVTCSRGLRHFRNPRRATCVTFSMTIPTSGISSTFTHIPELVLYPWGDDDNQTSDPSQNFQNPAYNGQRGVVGAGYREYIPAFDLDWYLITGTRMRDAIAAVRGRTYTLQQSIGLYPYFGHLG